MGGSKILSLVSDNGRDCRRQWPRQLMLLSARLLTTIGESPVRIRDLSPGGMRIEGNDLPEVGTDVLVKRGRFEAFGTIAWLSGTHAGIELDTALDDDAFAALDTESTSKGDRCSPQTLPGFGRKRGDHARWSDGVGWVDLDHRG